MLESDSCSATQTPPSGDAASARANMDGVGRRNSSIFPAVVNRPIRPEYGSEYQRFPSGPVTICCGAALGLGCGGNVVNCPSVVTRRTRPAFPPSFSVNQSAPSGPAVMYAGPPTRKAFGIGYSVTSPDVVILPI